MRCAQVFLLFLVSFGVSAWAGELDPPGSPAPTMHSLEDIYNAITTLSSGGSLSKTGVMVFPHILESSGSIVNTTYSYDTSVMFLYTAPYRHGLMKEAKDASVPLKKGVGEITVEVYLYDENGNFAKSGLGTDVAAPYVFTLSPLDVKNTIRVDNLFQSAGGFPSSIFLGYMVIRISGGDWNEVAVEAFTYNAHTNPFDTSIATLTPTFVPFSDGGAVKAVPVKK